VIEEDGHVDDKQEEGGWGMKGMHVVWNEIGEYNVHDVFDESHQMIIVIELM